MFFYKIRLNHLKGCYLNATCLMEERFTIHLLFTICQTQPVTYVLARSESGGHPTDCVKNTLMS